MVSFLCLYWLSGNTAYILWTNSGTRIRSKRKAVCCSFAVSKSRSFHLTNSDIKHQSSFRPCEWINGFDLKPTSYFTDRISTSTVVVYMFNTLKDDVLYWVHQLFLTLDINSQEVLSKILLWNLNYDIWFLGHYKLDSSSNLVIGNFEQIYFC